LVTNATTSLAFVQLGAGPASATDVPVLAGTQRVLQAGPYAVQIAVILATGSGTIYLTPGTGSV